MPRKRPDLYQECRFPNGFLWGASTAAHQVEGYQDNNWSRWEPTVAERLAKAAPERLRDVVPDWGLIKDEATDPNAYVSGEAADHYNRYEEDFDILAELGLNAYRLSIEWSRVEPEPGRFDRDALDHYRRVLKALHARNITPMVCLHHFTNPAWVDERGGWHDPEAADRFVEYAGKVYETLGDYCDMWLTFNEANSYCLSKYSGGGIWPDWPGAKVNPWQMFRAVRVMARAHKGVYETLKAADSDNHVSHDHGMIVFEPGRRDPVSVGITKLVERMSHLFARKVAGYEDFLGVHYYLKVLIKPGLSAPQQWQRQIDGTKTDNGWGIYPEGIYEITQQLKDRKLPIYITENGVADSRDALRADFIRDHLYWLHRSIQDGADVRGYFHWSLLDNFEWSEGFWPKLGLVEVDRLTGRRRIRNSARAYGEIARANAVDAD